MATVAGVKIKAKAPRASRMAFADEKYTGPEPQWDTERALKMDQTEFDHFLRKSFYYYNYHYNQKDTKKHVVEWMQNNDYPKAQVSDFIRSPDRMLSMTACSIVMAHRAGMPMRERQMEFLREQIAYVLEQSEPVVEAESTDKVVVKAPSIQDRLNEKTSEHLAYFEALYDEVVMGASIDPKAFDYLTANSVPQSQINKFVELFEKRKAEVGAGQGKLFEEHAEAYRHFKAADYKRHYAFLDSMLDSLEKYRDVKRATKKARVKKSPSKEKLVAKLKYCKQDPVLKLVSINPVDVIGAQELWVYNTKTRKLGQYVATSSAGFAIKGTSIENFTAKSVSKTLRKPEAQLADFMKAGKVQLRKYMEGIKATETLLNGRINADTVLLKVQ
jgi:hypothetical protein